MTPQRLVSLTLTPAAVAALGARGGRPLCLWVDRSTAPAELEVVFHAVGTRTCSVAEQPIPDLETFPLERVSPFLSRWLSLDYRHDRWSGEFGYAQRPSR